MEFVKRFLLTVCLGILAACAASRKVMLDPIGPHGAEQASGGNGVLMVYSAWERLNFGDPNHPHHTPYQILGQNSELIAPIPNYRGGPVEEPTPITLAEGKYQVSATGPGGLQVSVPIVIRRGQMTNLYLDGTTRPPNSKGTEDDFVRLPSGAIAGWRASVVVH